MLDPDDLVTPPTGDARAALGDATRRGIRWNLIAALASHLVRIVVVAALGRMLTDADFGIVAAAMTVVLFGGLLREAGLGRALIQHRALRPAHIETTFAMTILLGAGLAVTLWALAEPIAGLYRKPEAAEPLRILALLFVIRGVSGPSSFLLQREMRFGALAVIDVVSYTVGSAVSIGLALADYGWWALVIGYVAEAVVEALLLWRARPVRAWPRIERAALRDLFGFGAGQTVAGFANLVANQGDYVVVGRLFDAGLLGAYTRAYELMRFPSKVFNNIAGRVLFSSFAKQQDDPKALAEAFRLTLFLNAIVLAPASAGLAVLAPEGIRILLGPGWTAAVVPFQLMAASMLFRTSYKAASLVARSAGDVYRLALAQATYAVVVVVGAIIASRWGIVGIAGSTALGVALHFLNLTRLARRQVPIAWGQVLGAHLEGVILAAIAGGLALPIAWTLREAGMSAVPIALAATIAGAIGCAAYAFARVRGGHPDWRWAITTLRNTASAKADKAARKAAKRQAKAAAAEPPSSTPPAP